MPRPPENLAQTSGRGMFFDRQTAESESIVTAPCRAQTVPRGKQQGKDSQNENQCSQVFEGDAGAGNEHLPSWQSAGC